MDSGTLHGLKLSKLECLDQIVFYHHFIFVFYFISSTLCSIGLENEFSTHLNVHWLLLSMSFSYYTLLGSQFSCFPNLPMIIPEMDQNILIQEYALYLELGYPHQNFLFSCSELCSENPEETESWGGWSDILKLFLSNHGGH